jgi:repressor LexA
MLSPQQTRILQVIQDHTSATGQSPSIRTIASLMGLRSSATVHNHLRVLEERGYLRRISDRPRRIEVNFTGEWADFPPRSFQAGSDSRSSAGQLTGQALTNRQRRILEAIRDWIAEQGYPPSIREIAKEVGTTSTSSIHSQLEVLQRKGFIRRDPTKPRAIEINLDDPRAMPTPALSTRQRRILEVIRDAVADRDYPPSIREIGEAVGLPSTISVHSQLEALERKGFIRRDPTKPRAIEVHFDDPVAAVSRPLPTYVPLMSAPVAAGIGTALPEEAVDDLLPLPHELVGQGELFMLQVRGDSMVGAGVLDRDYVVVRRQGTAENGDMVVALLPNVEAEATVKHFSRKGGRVWLLPDNPAFEPIDGDQAQILGKVVTLIRRMTRVP